MSRWRYHAQRAVTGEWLHRDLPISRDELSWALSGPGSLRGTIAPDVGALRGPDGRPVLDEWGTYIYAEADGQIRWGGILIRSAFTGPEWRVEAAGFSSYPHGVPYAGELTSPGIDPTAAVAAIWSHLQGQPDGDLGMVVDAPATPVRLGTPAEPYSLVWWEAPDCGQEIDTLAQETPFDYEETHAWDGEAVTHRLTIGYPRLGRRRDDLAFVQGDNVVSVVTPERDGDRYANEVIGLGAGEGRAALQRRIPERDGRLRRPYVYSAKDVGTVSRMDALCRAELATRRQLVEISAIEVVDHPHAPMASWQLGDDVFVQAEIPWLGDVAVWHRIVGWSLIGADRAKLDLRRSDAFSYGSAI